jgi:transposase
MSTRSRRHWTAEEKLRILEEGRQTSQSVSAVCRHYQVAPGQYYAWEKQARQAALAALRNGRRGSQGGDPSQPLRADIERLRAVVAELSVENLQLKKGLWP